MADSGNGARRTLGDEQWRSEAQALIDDVKPHVKDIRLSPGLESTDQVTYLNLTTLEGGEFCVELSSAGLSIVGHRHDDSSVKGDELVFYETPYSLLDSVSPEFRKSFGGLLMRKLNALSEQR